jgi:hypothetical protein
MPLHCACPHVALPPGAKQSHGVFDQPNPPQGLVFLGLLILACQGFAFRVERTVTFQRPYELFALLSVSGAVNHSYHLYPCLLRLSASCLSIVWCCARLKWRKEQLWIFCVLYRNHFSSVSGLFILLCCLIKFCCPG